ncbi:unnamed protein product [Rotaria sp. Silwood1]|nr:unnamed protein product [Rotaria sp. Silwood1]
MTENHEPFIAVWLDSNNAIPCHESFHRKPQLSSIININIKFSDSDECLDYMKTIQTENIFFITSGSLGENIVPIIYHLPQLLYIYIYCSNKVKHEEWANNENYAAKIRGVFIDIDLLLAKINDDVKLELKNMLPLNIFQKYDDFKLKEMTIKDLSSQSAQFMWFQLLINTLIQGVYTQDAKDDMFHECVQQYDKNEIELQTIIDFYNNYTLEQAISWYTRNCFLYRLLNKAFRIQNIDFIYKFRFFIKDLYDQIKDIWLNQNKNSSFIKVYRGQFMRHDELEKLKEYIGQLISINAFFSTTLLSSVAIDFTGNGSQRPDYESVFFEINVDCTSTSKSFANIQNHSFIKDENEILFCVGTVFRIISVEDYDNVWHVILQTSNDENIELKELLEHFSKTVVEEKPTLFALADLLLEMGEYDKAQHFAQLFINELESAGQQQYISTVQSTIGLLDCHKGNYQKALKIFETALIMALQEDRSELLLDDLNASQHNLGII